ncbi:MAG: stage 0 sporulation protein [Candidatus Moranbacteria bacterium]|nr:stage 0 sporulation protein [Candidatus Moranbacteria bacterium]
MNKVLFYVYSWNDQKIINTNQSIELGSDYVIQTNFGQFIAKAKKILKKNKENEELSISQEQGQVKTNEYNEVFQVIRLADSKDLEQAKKSHEKHTEILQKARQIVNEFELPMKLVGVEFSLDESSLIIAFIAESRIDFRELVRKLSHTFQKAVRLEQIGSRDEAKIKGGVGPCGRTFCCAMFNNCQISINTDMARVQQITHRGNDRISGRCGRLMCCLAYEVDHYSQMNQNMPEINQKVKVDGQEGIVINKKVLNQKVLVKFSTKDKDKFEEKWFKVEDVNFTNKQV